MRKILALVVLLGLDVDPTMAAALFDERAKKFNAGYNFLKQHKYQEARTAFEAGLEQYPANALAHFYLGDACQGLKAWTCAEAHYETSLQLDAKSSVAGLAKQRGRKVKVWRLLDEGKQAINQPNALPEQVAQAEDTLEIAHKLGLDDEQQAVYQQLQGKIQQRHKVNHVNPPLAKQDERSMVLVPAGEFLMGSLTGDLDEQPVRRVYLDAYFLDKDQLTVGQYAKFLEATSHDVPPEWNIMSRAMHKNRPVVNVGWSDAAAYCAWAGKRQPTEAEWEKAARGTDGRTYPWGNEPPTKFHGNMKKELWNNHMGLTQVGMFDDGKSPYGINDMAGNVWEWVSDWYDPNYYHTAPLRNPTGPPTGSHKVVRGGSWASNPEGLRSAERETRLPSFQGFGTGFRCAKTP
ncbi:MAG TPA: SUMF1/EgtB/PvdO family nonheme iron enzyme [Nitrospiraceae bacterium]|nr:SUMF1/EgtB/PvdO family nonheme iron enzyme [Nitrospiraceae bacterium]